MPNWNYNSVEIHASPEAVKERLVPEKDYYRFNMHKLFPAEVSAADPTGLEFWSHDWFVENTGSKWPPEVYICASECADITCLSYDTAWSPNNGTLEKLHALTGWTIRNEYREEGMQFAGCLICEGDDCRDEEREYRSICEICEKECPDEAFDEDLDGLICNECRTKAKVLSN